MGINIRRNFKHGDSRETLREKFSARQQLDKNPFIIQVANHLIVLKVKEEDTYWWSPEVNIRIDSEAEASTVSEVIGPNSSIFTLAMFFIWIGAVAFLASFMMALAQYQIGNDHRLAFVSTLLSGLIIVITLLVLAMGRMKAKDQVAGLRQFVQDIISHRQ